MKMEKKKPELWDINEYYLDYKIEKTNEIASLIKNDKEFLKSMHLLFILSPCNVFILGTFAIIFFILWTQVSHMF